LIDPAPADWGQKGVDSTGSEHAYVVKETGGKEGPQLSSGKEKKIELRPEREIGATGPSIG